MGRAQGPLKRRWVASEPAAEVKPDMLSGQIADEDSTAAKKPAVWRRVTEASRGDLVSIGSKVGARFGARFNLQVSGPRSYPQLQPKSPHQGGHPTANVPKARPSMVSVAHGRAAKDLRRYQSYLASPSLSHLWTAASDVGPLCFSLRWTVFVPGWAPEFFAEAVKWKTGQEARLP